MAESMAIELRIDDEGSETVDVRPIGPGHFRLETTPIFCNREDDPLYLGDTIETEVLADGTHRLLAVPERSPLRHYSWVVPKVFVVSKEYPAFGDTIKAAGGEWEGALGGMLFVHLPADSMLDPAAELARRIVTAEEAAREA